MISNLSERLKELRKKRSLSQKELADILGVSPSIISAYETGERTPSVDVILSLSYFYNCSTDFLLGRNNDEPLESFDIFSDLTNEQIKALRCIIKGLRNTKK